MAQHNRTEIVTDWKSKNGLWRIHKPDYNGGMWLIENLKTGWCDYPIADRDNGRAAFNYPEMVPGYIKTQFKKMAFAEMDVYASEATYITEEIN